MKKVGQIMSEMGFNKDGADSAKEAFVKYLIKQATGVSALTPSEKKIIQQNPQKILNFPRQLEFSFDGGEIEAETESLKKA